MQKEKPTADLVACASRPCDSRLKAGTSSTHRGDARAAVFGCGFVRLSGKNSSLLIQDMNFCSSFFLAPQRRSGERIEEIFGFSKIERTSSPRPSPPALLGREGDGPIGTAGSARINLN
jgi:hypothetical protein